jgi:hypothetical protein
MAATRGWNRKANPSWQPEQSALGARAAIIASQDGRTPGVENPPPSKWGNTAANRAFNSERTGGAVPNVSKDPIPTRRKGSLMAASGAMSNRKRRSDSAPVAVVKPSYPDEANARINALRAATHAHNSSMKVKTRFPEGGASPMTNISKEMYTSHPPISSDVNEKNKSDMMQASAVAMARQMYKVMQDQGSINAQEGQQRNSNQPKMSSDGRRRSLSDSSFEPAPMRFNNLHEAAQRLAHERLAKLQDERTINRDYRDYYGGSTPVRTGSKLFSIARNRHRASSDGALDNGNQQSQRIRAEMSIFPSNTNPVDVKQRQMDRDALLAVAQRNVTKSLQDMDDQVFAETGKVTPAMTHDWETKANITTNQEQNLQMHDDGKVDIGGGVLIDRSAVDAVALRNVQPVIDDIDASARMGHINKAEELSKKEDRQRKKDAKRTEKKDQKEAKKTLRGNVLQMFKIPNSYVIAKEKEEKRLIKEKRLSKGAEKQNRKGKRMSKQADQEVPHTEGTEGNEGTSQNQENIEIQRDQGDVEMPFSQCAHMTGAVITSNDQAEQHTPDVGSDTYQSEQPNYIIAQNQPSSSELTPENQQQEESSPPASETPKGLKIWLKNKLGRRSSKTQKQAADTQESGAVQSFMGGAQLANSDGIPREPIDPAAQSSMSQLVIQTQPAALENTSPISLVSALSVDNSAVVQRNTSSDEFEEARDHFDGATAPAPIFIARPGSPARDSRFVEVI